MGFIKKIYNRFKKVINIQEKGVEYMGDDSDKKENYKRYFFVDYENVNRDGMNGIVKLSDRDCVRIYYSDAAETLTFGLHRRIQASQAKFDYIKIKIPIKNAVDCQILFDIEDFIRENKDVEYYIVSKDNDFDKAIDGMKNRKIKIKKITDIAKRDENSIEKQVKSNITQTKLKQTDENEKREVQVRSFFGEHFKEKKYVEQKEQIIHAIVESKTKQAVNNNLMKLYPNETVHIIYKRIQPLIKNLPGR